jgi:hypothetical protein
VARAVRERSHVNVFHRANAIKVDLFVMGGSLLDEEQMARRQRIQVTTAPDHFLSCYFLAELAVAGRKFSSTPRAGVPSTEASTPFCPVPPSLLRTSNSCLAPGSQEMNLMKSGAASV